MSRARLAVIGAGAARTLAAVLAVRESARSGRPVTLG